MKKSVKKKQASWKRVGKNLFRRTCVRRWDYIPDGETKFGIRCGMFGNTVYLANRFHITEAGEFVAKAGCSHGVLTHNKKQLKQVGLAIAKSLGMKLVK